jgi:hypothetical protein
VGVDQSSEVRRKPAGIIAAWLLFVFPVSGCELLTRSSVAYRSYDEILAVLSRELNFEVESSRFTLFHAQVREDAVLLYYRGVERPGDQAWVWRFSAKSTEQEPGALRDPASLLPIVSESRRSFEAEPVVDTASDGARIRYSRYRFESPVHGPDGRPLTARGVFAIVEFGDGNEREVFYVNLDNWGDRDGMDLEVLRPFLDAIRSSVG